MNILIIFLQTTFENYDIAFLNVFIMEHIMKTVDTSYSYQYSVYLRTNSKIKNVNNTADKINIENYGELFFNFSKIQTLCLKKNYDHVVYLDDNTMCDDNINICKCIFKNINVVITH